ncbi:MAG: FHA domain-containing protein [Pseudomonadota bacterium]
MRLNVRMEIPGKEAREFLYEFDQDVVTMGRDSHNDIQIPLTTVSRRHARLIFENGEYFIEDLNSTHGTLHNSKPLGQGGKKLLRDGDTVQVMHFKIQYSRVADKPLEFGSSERTEQLARRMVQEVLASMGEANEHPYLRVMNGPDEGKRFELSDAIAEVVIGRSSDCDLCINDANISRRHALVRKDWGGITIEDLSSKNGVVINDKKISGARAMSDSDEIMLGAVRLTFIDPTASILGKLDGIPAFEDQETVAGEGLDEEEDGEDEEEDADEEGDEEESGDEDDEDLSPDLGDEDGDQEPALDGDAPGGAGGELADGPTDLKGAEGDGASGELEVKVGGGKAEIIILIGVLLLVALLGGGLFYFLVLT